MTLPEIIHSTEKERWEMHFSLTTPGGKMREVQEWCWNTFGPNGFNCNTYECHWDHHGGWLYLYKEKYVAMFVLKWS